MIKAREYLLWIDEIVLLINLTNINLSKINIRFIRVVFIYKVNIIHTSFHDRYYTYADIISINHYK